MNALRDSLAEGAVLRGLWQNLPGPEAAELAARADAIARILAAGAVPGIFAADSERWIAAGARAISPGSDAVVLARGLRALL